MLSMIKHGKSRLPLERVPALAEALEIDPALLFRLALSENWPGYERTVVQIFGGVLNEEERMMIEYLRHITGGNVPKLNARLERAFRAAIETS